MTYEELAGGLRRLGEQGLIDEAPTGVYRSASDGRPRFVALTEEAYEQGVRDYRDSFAEDVAKVFGSRVMRATNAILGRGFVDNEAVVISFQIERQVHRAGGSMGEPEARGLLIFPVHGAVAARQRAELVELCRQALLAHKAGQRDVRLRFDDSEELAVTH